MHIMSIFFLAYNPDHGKLYLYAHAQNVDYYTPFEEEGVYCFAPVRPSVCRLKHCPINN